MPSDLFFGFGDFDDEISKKLRTVATPTQELEEALFAELHPHRDRIDLETVGDFLAHLNRFDFDAIYPRYLNHPIRVTASWLRTSSAPLVTEDVIFSLCHNAKEAGVLERLDSAFITTNVRSRIETLTIDRSREKDVPYRHSFYAAIQSHSDALFLYKCLDKLDNTFWWVMSDLEQYHVSVVEQEVLPVMTRIHPRLGAYFSQLLPHVLNPAVKKRYREEQASHD